MPCSFILARPDLRTFQPPLKDDHASQFYCIFRIISYCIFCIISSSQPFLFFVSAFPAQKKRQGYMPWRVAPQVRLELTTLRLTAECSAIELLRIIRGLWRGLLSARRSALSASGTFTLGFGARPGFAQRSALAPASASRLALPPRRPVLPYVLGAGKTFVPPAPLGSRQLPTLPSRSQLSTISVWRLNFCVRYGYRWCPPAIVTGNFPQGSFSLAPPFPAPSKLHSNRVDPQTFTLPNLPSLPFALSAASALSLPPLPSPSP